MFTKKIHTYILPTIVLLFILLWSYTATSKLADLTDFKRQLTNQTFSKDTASILLWLIPISELLAAFLLLFKKSQYVGLIFSFLLMLLFTSYIALVLAGYYDRVPCSCGGVLKSLSWQAHLWFNLFFLGISFLGIVLERRWKGLE